MARTRSQTKENCSKCQKPDSDKQSLIKCSTCSKSFHQQCENVPHSVWSWFIDTGHVFVCNSCRQPHPKKSKSASKPVAETDDIDQQDLDKKSTSSDNAFVEDQPSQTSLFQTIIRKEFARVRRKREIVVAGYTFSERDAQKDHAEQYQEDSYELDSFFSALGFTRDSCPDAYRFDWHYIGQQDLPDKPRLLLLRFEDQYIADYIKHISSRLRYKSGFQDVYVRESLSKEERIEKGKQRRLRKAQRASAAQ